MKEAGAKEVHVRIASPPLKYPCFYGIDIQTRKELIAANHTIDEIKECIGADSLGFLSEEGLSNRSVWKRCSVFRIVYGLFQRRLSDAVI